MRLLVILPRVPYPLEKGDKLRAYHQLRCLSDKFEIHLFCLNDNGDCTESKAALEKFCKSVTIFNLSKVSICWNVLKSFFNGKPLQVGYFYNCGAKKLLHRLINEIKPEHIYCQLLRVHDYIVGIDIPKTLDYQDVFSKGYERQATMVPGYLKPFYRMESVRLKKFEHRIFDSFNHHTIISEADREEIDHPKKQQISIIHNGVDFDYFKPSDCPKDVDILFTGNMHYLPNVTGVEFLVREILPRVTAVRSDIKVMIAGVNPSRRVLALKSAQVEITGWMEDIRNAYCRSKMFVAPMQIGTGLQNKLLEAMAMKIPCITSALANAGLGARHGEEILICRSPEEYAQAILTLLDDESRAKEIAEKAYKFVRENFDWKTETEKLSRILLS